MMRRKLFALLQATVLATLLMACSNNRVSKDYDTSKINDSVIKANNEFAFNLFKTINEEDAKENIFISPISISTALTMTYNGAETSTKLAMENALGYTSLDRGLINESYKNLIRHLENLDKKIDLNIGNSVWIREDQTINEEFIANNKTHFNAEVSSLDFSDPSAAGTINDWIKDTTKGKIEKMIDSPIDPDVIMYLINAIYFKGEWSEQFDPKRTTDAKFHLLDGSQQDVRMMNRHNTVEYGKGDGYKVVRLAYGSNKTSMYIILPDEGTDINDYIENLDMEKWTSIRGSVKEVEDMQLSIPKFKMEYGIKNLNDSLKALGMEEAFSDQADFSGIRPDIAISRVLHKAVIEVNEEGSEAAGATVVEVKETGALMDPITFIADRPFIFFITDDTTNTLLFMGKVLSI